MSYGAVGPYDAEFDIPKILSGLGILFRVPNMLLVLGMDEFGQGVVTWYEIARPEPENAKCLVGPMPFPGRNMPFPTAKVGDPLRVREVFFTAQ